MTPDSTIPAERLALDPISVHRRVHAAATAIADHAATLANLATHVRLSAAELHSDARPADDVLRLAALYRSLAISCGAHATRIAARAGAIETAIELLEAGEVQS